MSTTNVTKICIKCHELPPVTETRTKYAPNLTLHPGEGLASLGLTGFLTFHNARVAL